MHIQNENSVIPDQNDWRSSTATRHNKIHCISYTGLRLLNEVGIARSLRTVLWRHTPRWQLLLLRALEMQNQQH